MKKLIIFFTLLFVLMTLNAQTVWTQPKVVLQDSLFIMGNSCATDNGLMTVFIRLDSQLENQIICRTSDLNGNLLNEFPLTFIDSQTHISGIQICKTTNNDFIIVWCQKEFGEYYTMRAMKTNNNGEALWSEAPICGQLPQITLDRMIKAIPDQDGGAFIVWSNSDNEYFFNQVFSDASIVSYTPFNLGEFSFMESLQYYVFNHRLYLIVANGIFVSPYQNFQSYFINLGTYNNIFKDFIVFNDFAYLLTQSSLIKLNLQNFEISVLETSENNFLALEKVSDNEFVLFDTLFNGFSSSKHYNASGIYITSYQNDFSTYIVSLKDDSSYRSGDNLYFTKMILDHLDDYAMPYLYLFKYNINTHDFDYDCLYFTSFDYSTNQYGPYTTFVEQQLTYYLSNSTSSGLELAYYSVNLNTMQQTTHSQLNIDLNINHLQEYKSVKLDNQLIYLIHGNNVSKIFSLDDQLSSSSIDYNSKSFQFQNSYLAPIDNNYLLSVISMYYSYPGSNSFYSYANILDSDLQTVTEFPDINNFTTIPLFGKNDEQNILLRQYDELLNIYSLSSEFTLLNTLSSNSYQYFKLHAFKDNYLLFNYGNQIKLTHFTDQYEIDPLWGQGGISLTQLDYDYQFEDFTINQENDLLLISYIENTNSQKILNMICFNINTRQVVDSQSIAYNTQLNVKKVIKNNYLYLAYSETINHYLKIQCFSFNENEINEEWNQILTPYTIYDFDMKLANQRLLCAFVLKNYNEKRIFLKTLSLTGGPDQLEYPYLLHALYPYSSNVEIISDESNQAYINRLESRDTYNVSLVTDLIDMSHFLGTEDPAIQPELKFAINNYPNPFNPSTSINYTLECESRVCIDIFNIKGQKVKTLIDDVQSSGQHSLVWNGTDQNGNACSSGIYFYKFISEDHQLIKKMLMVK